MKIFLTFLTALFLDQLSKAWVYQAQPIARHFIGLQYSENYGILFGIQLPTPVIYGFTVLILLGALALFGMEARKRPLGQAESAALGLIMAGGIGNLLDRMRLGFVVDFIHIGPYPNFNLADTWIVLGVILLLFSEWRRSQHP